MNARGVVPGILAVLVLAGANNGSCRPDREIAVRALGSGLHCGGPGEGVSLRRLASADELESALSGGLSGKLGVEPKAPEVDFARELVVLVSAGQKPTAGYGVELASPKAPVKDGAAGVRVLLRAPAKGMLSAQMMTSPCLVVALPSEGLKGVGVLDGDEVAAKLALE